MTTATAQYTFLVNSLPEGDFDWITLWEGECNILTVGEDSEDGSYEYYEVGKTSFEVKRETEDEQTTISMWIPNHADFPSELNKEIQIKFGIDTSRGSWSSAEEGQYGSYSV